MEPVIILDYDGVVADSFGVYYEEYVRTCRRFGLSRLGNPAAFLRIYEGDRMRRLVWAVVPNGLMRLGSRLLRPKLEAAGRRIRPFDGMREVVSRLGARFPVYVVTSNTTDSAQWLLDEYGFEEVRAVIGVDRETSKVKKIRRVMGDHDGSPVFYVGDTKVDMHDAREAGAIPVAATWGWHPREKLLEGNPAHVVDSPEALESFFVEAGGHDG